MTVTFNECQSCCQSQSPTDLGWVNLQNDVRPQRQVCQALCQALRRCPCVALCAFYDKSRSLLVS